MQGSSSSRALKRCKPEISFFVRRQFALYCIISISANLLGTHPWYRRPAWASDQPWQLSKTSSQIGRRGGVQLAILENWREKKSKGKAKKRRGEKIIAAVDAWVGGLQIRGGMGSWWWVGDGGGGYSGEERGGILGGLSAARPGSREHWAPPNTGQANHIGKWQDVVSFDRAQKVWIWKLPHFESKQGKALFFCGVQTCCGIVEKFNTNFEVKI